MLSVGHVLIHLIEGSLYLHWGGKVHSPFMSGQSADRNTSLRWYLWDVVFWKNKTVSQKSMQAPHPFLML